MYVFINSIKIKLKKCSHMGPCGTNLTQGFILHIHDNDFLRPLQGLSDLVPIKFGKPSFGSHLSGSGFKFITCHIVINNNDLY